MAHDRTGVELFFDVANEDTKRFWRVIEKWMEK